MTSRELVSNGYTIENAQITDVDLIIEDHDYLTVSLTIEGDGWGVVYGGYALAKRYVDGSDDHFSGSGKEMESIVRIMDVIECDRFNDMKGKYVRVATQGILDRVKIIGNITKDKWFDIEEFFKE